MIYNERMTNTSDRLLKRDCTLISKAYFTGRDYLDRPVEMNRLTFRDHETGYLLVWNTQLRPILKEDRDYLFSATLLESAPIDRGKGPEFRVTRGKVYDAPTES